MNSDFKELFSAFIEFDVRHLSVGGYAVIHYTEPRYTKDIDLWILPTSDNAMAVRKALMKFGAWLDCMNLEDFATPNIMFQIGLPPSRIDFLTSIADLNFEQCWARRTIANICGMNLAYLHKDDLIASKQKANRLQDQIDLQNLQL